MTVGRDVGVDLVVKEVAIGPLAITLVAVPDGVDDQALDFGELQIGRGQAFTLANVADTVAVGKSWDVVAGRTFLIEAVKFSDVAPLLNKLPQQAQKAGANPAVRRLARAVKDRRQLLAQLAPRKPAATPKQEARIRDRRAPAAAGKMSALATDRASLVAALIPITTIYDPSSLVLDYTTISVNQSGYTFRSDSTYYITAPVNLSGTTIIEGGTVIKFPNTNSPKISITGSGAKVICLATNYRPAVLTAKDDNSVGEWITGSTGTPSGYYASTALYLDYSSSGVLSQY